MNKLFIPKQIKVGFQTRQDTYTGKLGYVIYRDQTGTLRKSKSWEGWRDKSIEPLDFDNIPTEGFVLNRDVGGKRNSWGSWSHDIRMEKVRVYDPRGFEFEITIPNLLFILQECTSVKGKGLEGELVYGWDGSDLTLLPASCSEYLESIKYTDYQKTKFDPKELKMGFVYRTKKMEDMVYLGQHVWFGYGINFGKKCHIFGREISGKHLYKEEKVSTDFLAERISDTVSPQFSDMFELLQNSTENTTCKSIIFTPKTGSRYYGWSRRAGYQYDGRYFKGEHREDYNHDAKKYIHKVTLKDEFLIADGCFVTKRHKVPIVLEGDSLAAMGVEIGGIEILAENGQKRTIAWC